MPPRRTAVLMIGAAVLVNVAFTGLGTVFDYPDVLKHPADEVLASFRASQGAVSAWFLALALGRRSSRRSRSGWAGCRTCGLCGGRSPSASPPRRSR